MTKRKQKSGQERRSRARDGDVPVISIYESELLEMCRIAASTGNLETGGSLHGWPTPSGNLVVALAPPPGAGAVCGHATFSLDVDQVRHVDQRLHACHGLAVVARWHDHHSLGITVPSGHDRRTGMSTLRKSSLTKFGEIILSRTSDKRIRISPYVYVRVAGGVEMVEARLRILAGGASPFREHLHGSDTDILGRESSCPSEPFPRSRIVIDRLIPDAASGRPSATVPPELARQIGELPESMRDGVEVTVDGNIAVVSVPLTVRRNAYFAYPIGRLSPKRVSVEGISGGLRDVTKHLDLADPRLEFAAIVDALIAHMNRGNGSLPSAPSGEKLSKRAVIN